MFSIFTDRLLMGLQAGLPPLDFGSIRAGRSDATSPPCRRDSTAITPRWPKSLAR
jgi:hypothetical protein